MTELQDILGVFTTFSFGLMAGIYFIFSNSVMKGLANIPETQAAMAMSQINNVILNPMFSLLFWGSGIGACSIMASFFSGDVSIAILMSALMFFVGSILVTLLVNVPLNKELASAIDSKKEVSDFWSFYLKKWTRWNHVRTICTSAGFIILMLVKIDA